MYLIYASLGISVLALILSLFALRRPSAERIREMERDFARLP